jgi:hypothetical protein
MYLSVCLSIYLFVCLSVHVSIHVIVSWSICLSTYSSIYLYLESFIYLCFYVCLYNLSIYLSIFLSIYLFICLPTHQSSYASICLCLSLSKYSPRWYAMNSSISQWKVTYFLIGTDTIYVWVLGGLGVERALLDDMSPTRQSDNGKWCICLLKLSPYMFEFVVGSVWKVLP